MKDFNNFIESLELIDLNMHGRLFTWCNALDGERWSRIDRFLLDPVWLERYKFKQWGLPRVISDHCPVLLMEDGRDWGPKPFRFINAWTSHPQFKKEVEKVWEEVQIQGWASFRIMIKLKRLRAYLRRWNMEVFGNIDDQLKQAEDELHEWDLKAESRSLLEAEVHRRREIRSQVWQLSRSKERMWLQKSRMSWAQNGDKNTRLFHLMASNRQRKNSLDSVQVNGVAVEDPSIVKQVVENYFTRVFAESWESRPKLAGSFLSITDVDSKEVLEANFSEAEIWAAIQDCDGNKAPGPDGFNLHCIQKCWSIMKGDFMQLFQEFHRNGKLAKGVNSSFITLIPKKKNPLDLSDFRPISLVSSIYKVLAKVLSRRIRQVLPKLIGEVQTAFLSGRCILDGVLIANEVVDWWRKSKKKGVILKLDFEKAYDSVNWEFLLSMMENFGFGVKWVGWIRSCISTSRISVLVNGSPTAEFSPQRGLRQGDPLSPFLFTIVAEGLNILLERAKEQGMIRGASVGHQELIISHLQFADDTIIFCEANWDEIRVLKRILRCFEVMSGLKINFHKSIVCGIGVEEELVKEFANNLNCLSQSLPLSYLGLPLGANPRKKSTWKPVVEKVKKKLASWKRRFLSFAGRLTLIKSGLSNLPVYFLSIFKLPIGVAKTIDRIQSNFLWGGSEVLRKIHLVQWKEVCKSKAQGGLGVRSLSDVNICLMLKWWWRYGHQQQSLWKMVVCSRYGGNEGRWKPETVSAATISTVWKDIVSLPSANTVAAEFFSQNFRIILGNGERIHFWTDRWFNDMSLRSEFPRLFSLSVEKEGALQFFYHRKGPGSDWKLAFRRSLLAWEEEEVHRLNVLLAEVPNLNPLTEDYCLWRASNSGVFSVASVWKRLELVNGPTVSISKFLWKNAAPPQGSVLQLVSLERET
ncbi:unnamed protein product [Camellia sinensis]